MDATIKILERFDGFELTILDRSNWNKQQQGNVSWSVSDGNRIDFERGFVETDDLYRSLEQRSLSGDWKVRLTVEDRAMGDVFEGAFDRFWSEAGSDGTSISNRRDVVNYLYSLRAKINGN